jgi:hypothetical protein
VALSFQQFTVIPIKAGQPRNAARYLLAAILPDRVFTAVGRRGRNRPADRVPVPRTTMSSDPVCPSAILQQHATAAPPAAGWSQGLADWIGCHVNALGFFGGVTRQIVCDNLKAGVTAANRYEPGINRTYQEMAAHYGTAIVPTRVRKCQIIGNPAASRRATPTRSGADRAAVGSSLPPPRGPEPSQRPQSPDAPFL